MFDLTGKRALVTGASSGIGLAVTQRFLAAGARVMGVDLACSDALTATGVPFAAADVSVEAEIAAAFAAAAARFGALDVVVNNAGIGPDEGPLTESDAALFRHVLDVNLVGVLLGIKHGARMLDDGGCIINTASSAAFSTVPEYTGYSASKAGVVKLTQQAAVELASRGIRVNAVCPGTTTTLMEGADSVESRICAYTSACGRPATPEEQAAVFHFLASDDSRYVNAQAICVDGGSLRGINPRMAGKLLE